MRWIWSCCCVWFVLIQLIHSLPMIRQSYFDLLSFTLNEFSVVELIALYHQLDNYILDVHSNNQFYEIVEVSGLTKKMVQLKKHRVYPLVYLLMTSTTLTCCNCNCLEGIFCNENHQDSITQSIGRWFDEWLFGDIYWKKHIRDYWQWKYHSTFSKYETSKKIIIHNFMFFWMFFCVRDIISLYMVNFILSYFDTHKKIFLYSFCYILIPIEWHF